MTGLPIDFTKGAGLVPCIAQDHATGRVLMLAYVDEDALRTTLATGRMHYHSRTRGALWEKGATSGHTQRLVGLSWDCDADTLLAQVEQAGPACHAGTRTCFDGRHKGRADAVLPALQDTIAARQADPQGWTGKLLGDVNLRLKKVVEEAGEVVMACKDKDPQAIAAEVADLWYHSLVAAAAEGVTLEDVLGVLAERHDKWAGEPAASGGQGGVPF